MERVEGDEEVWESRLCEVVGGERVDVRGSRNPQHPQLRGQQMRKVHSLGHPHRGQRRQKLDHYGEGEAGNRWGVERWKQQETAGRGQGDGSSRKPLGGREMGAAGNRWGAGRWEQIEG